MSQCHHYHFRKRCQVHIGGPVIRMLRLIQVCKLVNSISYAFFYLASALAASPVQAYSLLHSVMRKTFDTCRFAVLAFLGIEPYVKCRTIAFFSHDSFFKPFKSYFRNFQLCELPSKLVGHWGVSIGIRKECKPMQFTYAVCVVTIRTESKFNKRNVFCHISITIL